MENVLITGGTGLIGTHLAKKLEERGYKVTLLSRKKDLDNYSQVYSWDPEKNLIDTEALVSADYIIHLAGAGIGDKRWTKRRKQLIIDSRVMTGNLIFNKVKETGIKLKAFISASGISYYGSITSEKIFRETDPPGEDFLANVCLQWEQMADRFEESGIRRVKIRTGIVLAENGGALQRMITPVKFGIGSALGQGNQYIPWIHIEDLCNIYIRAIEDSEMSGAYNATSPHHITNRDFVRSLARVLNKPFFAPPVPAIIMKLLFGEMSEILLNGSRISSEKLTKSGYSFAFPDLGNALKDIL
jgi:uncharacterized protein (TIGR01777 family)